MAPSLKSQRGARTRTRCSDIIRVSERTVLNLTVCHQVAEDKPGGELAYWAEKELRRVVAEEREWRYRLQRTG